MIRAAARSGCDKVQTSADSAADSAPTQANRTAVNRTSEPMLLHARVKHGTVQPEFAYCGIYIIGVRPERFFQDASLDPLAVQVVWGQSCTASASGR